MTPAQDTAILELAAAGGDEETWWRLMDEVLKLPARYAPAVREVLGQGRWRGAENQAAYVITATKREAKRLGIGEEIIFSELPSPKILDRYDDGDGDEDDESNYNVLHNDIGERVPAIAGRPVPPHLLKREGGDPEGEWVVDWGAVASRAGLDAGEMEVLRLFVAGRTGEAQILAVAKDEDERKRLRATWHRLQRDFGRLRGVLAASA